MDRRAWRATANGVTGVRHDLVTKPHLDWIKHILYQTTLEGLATVVFSEIFWCEELTHLKRPWCWEWLKAGGEGDDRIWDGWMASLTQWTWARVSSGSWWWTGKPGVLQSMGSQRVGHNWATELNWDLNYINVIVKPWYLKDILVDFSFLESDSSFFFNQFSLRSIVKN